MSEAISRQSDSTRMKMEGLKNKVDSKHEVFANQGCHELANRFKQMGYVDVKFDVVSPTLTMKEPFEGTVTYKVAFTDREGEKTLTLDVPVAAGKFSFIEQRELAAKIQEVAGRHAKENTGSFFDVDLTKFSFHDESGDSYRIDHHDLGTLGYVLKNEIHADNLPRIEAKVKRLALESVRQNGHDPKFFNDFALPEITKPVVKQEMMKKSDAEWLNESSETCEVKMDGFKICETETPDVYFVEHSTVGKLGTIGKAMYDAADEKFVEALKQFTSSVIHNATKYEAKFVGEFVKPEITKMAIAAPVDDSLPLNVLDMTWLNDEPVVEETPVANPELGHALMHDVVRQQEEAEAQRIKEEEVMVMNTAEQQVWQLLRHAKFEDIKMHSGKTSFQGTKTHEGWQGEVTCSATIFANGDYRDVTVSGSVSDSSFIWSESPEDLVERLESGNGHKANLTEKLHKEAALQNTGVDEYYEEQERMMVGVEKKASLEKEAESAVSINTPGIPAVVFFPKMYLPDSAKAGDIINVSGYRFRLVSDEVNKLSAQGTGSYWTAEALTGISPDSDKAKVHRLYNY